MIHLHFPFLLQQRCETSTKIEWRHIGKLL